MATDNPKQLTSANQGDKSSLWAALSFAMRQNGMSTDGMLPARVISYKRGGQNLVTVKPVIHFVDMENNAQPRQQLVDVPCLAIGGGGFLINFPLNAGDLGWIFASDRDMNNFMKELKDGVPPNGRIKSFSSGLFIPDALRQFTLAGEDADAMVIQSTSGAVKISLREDNIKIAASTKVLIETPLTEFTQDVKIDGRLDVTKKTTVNGGFEATGGDAVTLPDQSTIGGIQVLTHGHEQNGDSGRTSGGMEA